jgi:MFS family permease
MAGPVHTATLVVAARTALVSSVPVGALGLGLGRLPHQLVVSSGAIMLMGLMQAVLALVGGQLADRWSRSVVTVVGAGATTVAYVVVAAWGARPAVAVGAAAVIGSGVGLFLLATSGLIQQLVPDGRLLRANALLLAATVAGKLVVGTLAPLLIAVPFGWSALLVPAILLSAAAAVLALLVHRRRRHGAPSAEPARTAGGTPRRAAGGEPGVRTRPRWWMWVLVTGLGVLAAIAAAPDAVMNLPAGFHVDAGPDLPRQIAAPLAVIGVACLLVRLPVRRPARLALLVCLGVVPALAAIAGSAAWWLSATALTVASTTGMVFAMLSETVLELHAPTEVVSRTVGLVFFVQGLVPFAALLLAVAGHRQLIVVLAGTVLVLVGVALAVPGIRRLPNHRTLPAETPHRQRV